MGDFDQTYNFDKNQFQSKSEELEKKLGPWIRKFAEWIEEKSSQVENMLIFEFKYKVTRYYGKWHEANRPSKPEGNKILKELSKLFKSLKSHNWSIQWDWFTEEDIEGGEAEPILQACLELLIKDIEHLVNWPFENQTYQIGKEPWV